MTRIAQLCLAHMMAIQIASKQSYFNTTWGKDYSHYVPPHNARNNRKLREKEVKEQIKELALRTGFKLKEQPDGSMDLNPYVYDFAQTLLANVWVYFDDGMPTVGKVAKFMAKNGITVIGKFQAYGIGEYGVQVLDDEVWSIDMFDKWQPYEDNQDD